MIEFSFTELVLLVWAITATASAFHYKDKAKMAGLIIHKIVDDTELYTKMRKQWVDFKEQHNA